MKNGRPAILSNRTAEEYARTIADDIGFQYIETERQYHPDGELGVHIKESIRGADVFYICPYYPDPMKRHTENMIMTGTIKDASANRLTLVPTYLGFQRSDWKDKSRVPISIKYVIKTLQSVGMDKLLTMHLHAPQIQGMFDNPVDVLQALPIFEEWYHEMGLDPNKVVVVSTDSGGTKYCEQCAGVAGVKDVGFIYKRRLDDEEVETHDFSGEAEGKVVIMPDDQLSTGNSLRKGAKRLKEKHGAEKVYGFCTHAIFSKTKNGSSEDLFKNDEYLDRVVVTDTIPREQKWIDKYKDRIQVRSSIDLFSKAIERIHNDESLSDLFQT